MTGCFLSSAETCTDPVITPSSYTSTDALISSETVFIVELSLACANGAQVSGLTVTYIYSRYCTEMWTDKRLVLFLECCSVCRRQWQAVSCDQRPRCWQIPGKVTEDLKGWLSPKMFCHNLFQFHLFQTCMRFFGLLNTK